MINKIMGRIFWLLLILTAAGTVFAMRAYAPGFFSQKARMEKKAELYYCPMHPDYTAPKPGKCPICHMDLVLAEEENRSETGLTMDSASGEVLHEFTLEEVLSMKPGEICLLHQCKMGTCMIAMTKEIALLGKCPHCGEDLGVVIKTMMPEGYGHVQLGLGKRQLIGVKTERVEIKALRRTVRAAATVAHDAELYRAQAEYIQALRALKKAQGGNLEETLRQARELTEAARIRLRHLGLSDALIEETGLLQEPDHGLLYAHGGEDVWVYANIYEYEVSGIRAGQSMTASSPAYPGNIFTGEVKAVDPMVDMKTRTTRVRARFPNPEGLLKPDMFLNASIEVPLGEMPAIPRSAVLDTGTRKIIFVEKADGDFEPREAILGAAMDDYYPVQSGVTLGEKVVTSGNFLLDSESRLKAALQGASQRGGHAHGG